MFSGISTSMSVSVLILLNLKYCTGIALGANYYICVLHNKLVEESFADHLHERDHETCPTIG